MRANLRRPSLEADLSIAELAASVRAFTKERDWEQFHSPKNLSMALASEAGELLDIFRWLTEEESAHLSDDQRQEVAAELVDTLWFLVRLIDVLDVDIQSAWQRKVSENESRYDASTVRGSAQKR